mmetsp:Transcript_13017/g.32455  ORF Transcript_13017/g.32455 Transcript_13017/m.32455 type:complete len:272 (+) Transcript_13017:696-1511(+)
MSMPRSYVLMARSMRPALYRAFARWRRSSARLTLSRAFIENLSTRAAPALSRMSSTCSSSYARSVPGGSSAGTSGSVASPRSLSRTTSPTRIDFTAWSTPSMAVPSPTSNSSSIHSSSGTAARSSSSNPPTAASSTSRNRTVTALPSFAVLPFPPSLLTRRRSICPSSTCASVCTSCNVSCIARSSCLVNVLSTRNVQVCPTAMSLRHMSSSFVVVASSWSRCCTSCSGGASSEEMACCIFVGRSCLSSLLFSPSTIRRYEYVTIFPLKGL